MIKLYRLMRYFVRPDRPNSEPFRNEIEWGAFWWYLVFENHFREHWKSTLNRWLRIGNPKDGVYTEKRPGVIRAKKQRQEIDDLINKAIENEYLILSIKDGGKKILTMGRKGREFLKIHYFLNAVFKEFGPLTSFLVGVISTSIFGTVLLKWNVVWDELTSILSKLFI